MSNMNNNAVDYEKGSSTLDPKFVELEKMKKKFIMILVAILAIGVVVLGGFLLTMQWKESKRLSSGSEPEYSDAALNNPAAVNVMDRIFLNSDNLIISINADGTDVRSHGQLGDKKLLGHPIWNAHTRKFGLSCFEGEETVNRLYLYEWDDLSLEGGFRVPHPNVSNPVFSPDGKQIVFNESDYEKTVINVMNADGSEVRTVVSKIFSGTPLQEQFFTSDGKAVIFASDCGQSFHRVDVTATGSEPQTIENVPASNTFLVSPVKDQIFEIIRDYSSFPNSIKFVLFDMTTKTARTVFSTDSNVSYDPVAWSTNGDFIYMIKRVNRNKELVKFNLETADFIKIADLPLNI